MKLLILALDGFDPHLFSNWRDQLPHLSSLADLGCCRPVLSTFPPMTFPAWSTFLTGANPGAHGIFDFTERLPGCLGVRFVNATRRRLPTFLNLVSEAGLKVGSVGIPTTYPPEPLSGYQISGFDTPLPSKADPSYVYPPELADRINRELGGYYYGDFNETRIGKDWHRQTLEKLFSGVRRKVKLAHFLQREYPVDLMVLHIGETDTVGHHYWAFHDSRSPRHVEDRDPRLASAILDVYRAADDLVGELLSIAKPENVIVVSDHGMGGTSDRVLYLNRYLESCGLLKFKANVRGSLLLHWVKILGMRWMPYSLQQQVFKIAGGRLASNLESAHRFRGMDWAGTTAYSEELNYFPAVWLNREGREPYGIIKPQEIQATLNRVKTALMEWRDPHDGVPIVQTVYDREEIYSVSEVTYAPDLILELRQPGGYCYALGRSTLSDSPSACRKMNPAEHLGFKGVSMNGSHRRAGTFILKTSRKLPTLPPDFSLEDIAPLIFRLVDLSVPNWMRRNDSSSVPAVNPTSSAGIEIQYTPVEEDALRRRLTGMGYL